MKENFYFSFTYNLSHTLQENILKKVKQQAEREERFDEIYTGGRQTFTQRDFGVSINRETKINFENFEDYYPYNETFLWNYFLMNDFYFKLKNKQWAIPIVHGFIDGINMETCAGRLSFILIA